MLVGLRLHRAVQAHGLRRRRRRMFHPEYVNCYGEKREQGFHYGNHDHFRAQKTLGGVACAAEVQLQEKDGEETYYCFQNRHSVWNIVYAFGNDVAQDWDRHPAFSLSQYPRTG